jgi:hypothetical protein
MRKLFYLGFCLVLVMGVGCAITDYTLITDNDQVKQGAGNATVNTNGKAHIRSYQIATLWGTDNDELINFVDQKSNGDRTMTTYNNFSTSFVDPTFHDDLYCNPDWQGCAIWTAHDPPGYGYYYAAYDGVWNQNCSGSRSIYLLAGTERGGIYNYGECGRGGFAQKLAILNMGQAGSMAGMDGLWFNFNRNNTTVTVNGHLIPVVDTNAFVDPISRIAAFDMSHPLMATTLRSIDAANGAGNRMDLSITYNGYTFHRGFFQFKDLGTAALTRN